MSDGPGYLVLRIDPPPRGEVHLYVDALRRAGARSVERDGEVFEALFPEPADVGGLVAEVRSGIRAATSLTDPGIRWERQRHAEWAARWRTEQAARRVSERIIVAPVGVDVEGGSGGLAVGVDDVVVRLDPGVAFGTAEHPTTRSCLALLDGRVSPGTRVLDVGAGSGILAVAAALLGAVEAMALEVDPHSCEAARRNVEANGVGDRVEVREVEVTPSYLRGLGRYDGVVINIEARISARLVPEVPAVLRRGGWLILSGVVGAEKEDAIEAAGRAGLGLVEEAPVRSWWTGAFSS